MDSNTQMWNLACRTSKKYHNGEKNLYVYEFHQKISEIVNAVTKIPRVVKKQTNNSFLIFAGRSFF